MTTKDKKCTHACEAKGYKSFTRMIAGQKRREQTIKKRGSLYEKNNHLAMEWDAGGRRYIFQGGEQRNSKQVSGGGGRESGYWLCADCNHFWKATVRDRLNKSSGCPECYKVKRAQMPLTHTRSVIQNDPLLRQEYFIEKNGRLDELSVRLNQKIFWKCSIPQHEPFMSTTKDRRPSKNRQGSRCPSCASNSLSPIQASIAQYIKNLLRDFRYKVSVREKVMGYEADIFIPDLCCIIEIDGYPWHDRDGVIERDLRKSRAWQAKGYRVFRLRDARLQSEVFAHDVVCADRVEIDNLESCCGTLLQTIHDELDLEHPNLAKVLGRIITDGFHAGELDAFYYTQPQPPEGESLLDKWPNLCRYWAPSNPVGPMNFYPFSNLKAYWICPICGVEYRLAIAQRVKIDDRDGSPRRTHRKCCQKVRHAANADQIREWILADSGPAILPDELRSKM